MMSDAEIVARIEVGRRFGVWMFHSWIDGSSYGDGCLEIARQADVLEAFAAARALYPHVDTISVSRVADIPAH